MSLLVARIVNNPTLTRHLRRHLTHLGDGLLVGNLSTRTREQLINHIRADASSGRYTIAWTDPAKPQGWTHIASAPLPELDGITLAKSQNSNNTRQARSRT